MLWLENVKQGVNIRQNRLMTKHAAPMSAGTGAMSGSSIHVSRTSSRLPPKSRGSSSEAVSYQIAVPVAAGLPS